ncbi:MAG: patatin-like phospholipase family protein [Bacteroidota bacterium]
MKICFLGILFFIISTISLQSQTVGVVLSGGGAKGMAHIGVLKALEENNIPIDYIAGTSIGAIIAGLYSIGYSPEDMEELFKSDDFNRWAFGIMDEKYIYYSYEDDPNAAWVALDFKYDSVFQPILPTNFISPNQMDFAFMKIFSSAIAKANYNFDSLFIPFRCVATDVYANEAIVFRSGQLPSAIRASMTIPLYFKPITIDGRLLFDGGILNNFPIDIVISDFNPDIIIGSKVSFNSEKPDDDDLLSQIENLVTVNSDFSVPENKGILIEPVVSNIRTMDWYKADELIKNGYSEASYRINEIRDKIYRKVERPEVEKKRIEYRAGLKDIEFKSINISGINSGQKKYVYNRIQHKKKLLTINQLEKEFFSLANDEKISSIYPVAKYDSINKLFDLDLDIRLRKKFEAEIGGNISSRQINQAYVGGKYHYLDNFAYTLSSNIYFGKFYTSAMIKGRVDFPFNRPFFLDASLIFNRWDYFRSYSGLFFSDIRPSYLVQNETNIRLNIGFPIKNKNRIIFGTAFSDLYNNYYQTQNFFKADTTDKTSFRHLASHLTYERKTINFKQFGNKGSYLLFKLLHITGQEKHVPGSTALISENISQNHSWFMMKFQYNKYFKTKGIFTPGILFETVISDQSFFSNYTSTMVMSPAFQPDPYSKTIFMENFRAHRYTATGLKTVFRITKSLDLRLEANIFIPFEKILKDFNYKPYYSKELNYQYYTGTAALVYHTPIGPASFSFHYYDNESKQTYFVFNFGYILFNKRAIDF